MANKRSRPPPWQYIDEMAYERYIAEIQETGVKPVDELSVEIRDNVIDMAHDIEKLMNLVHGTSEEETKIKNLDKKYKLRFKKMNESLKNIANEIKKCRTYAIFGISATIIFGVIGWLLYFIK